MTLTEKVARTPWLRMFLRLFWWDLTYHCPGCGKRLVQRTCEDLSEEERWKYVRANALYLLRYEYQCKNTRCEYSKDGTGWMIG